MVYMENRIKMDDLGVPPILGNTHTLQFTGLIKSGQIIATENTTGETPKW